MFLFSFSVYLAACLSSKQRFLLVISGSLFPKLYLSQITSRCLFFFCDLWKSSPFQTVFCIEQIEWGFRVDKLYLGHLLICIRCVWNSAPKLAISYHFALITPLQNIQKWPLLPLLRILLFVEDVNLETSVLWLVHSFFQSCNSAYDYVYTFHFLDTFDLC